MKNNRQWNFIASVASISLLLSGAVAFASDPATIASSVVNNPGSLVMQVEELCKKAEAQADQRDYSAAETSAEKALKLAQTQGDKHPLTAKVLRTKAYILVDEKKLADAEVCANEALNIDKSSQDNSVLAKDYLKLAGIYVGGLRLAPAYHAAESTVELAQKETGKKSMDAAEALLYLALLDKMCGQPDKAEDKIHKALAIANDFPNTKFEVDVLKMHATLLEQNGKFEQALPINQQALAKAEAKYGANSASAEKCMRDLADCYTHLEKFQEAYDIDKRRVPLVKKIYGSSSSEMVALYDKMGDLEEDLHPDIYNNRGNPGQYSTPITETGGQIFATPYPKKNRNHTVMAPSKVKAFVISQGEKYTPKIESATAVLAGQLALGQRSGSVILPNSDVDPTQKALSSLPQTIKKDEQRYGKMSPMFTSSLGTLGQLYMATGDYNKAKECFKRETDIYDDAIGSLIPPNEPCPLASCVLADYQKGRMQAQKEYEKAMAASKK